MIKNKFKLSLLATAMICAAGVSGVSSAHQAPGSLAATSGAIDVYHTSCFTWTAAGAAAATIINGETETALPAKRFVARVAKQCAATSQNATCNAAANIVTVSIAGKDGSPTVAGTGISASTTTAVGAGVQDAASALWLAPWSAWVATANNGAATNKNGDYIFAVAHSSAVANPYLAEIHCENVAVGASPVPGTNGIHTGTGVTATGGTIASPFAGSPVGTTGGDFNQIINQ